MSRIATHAHASVASATMTSAVVARPGRRSRSGATTTRAAKPVTADIQAGLGVPSATRIARPIAREARTMSSVQA